MRHQRSVTSAGFTLVELLTVIAVVAVLASILFAVFARVRENGRRAVCQSNLKQIALAMQQYVQDHDGRYARGGLWHDEIQPYLKTRQVYICPSQDVNAPDRSGLDYRYNAAVIGTLPRRAPHYVGKHESEFSRLTTTWMHSDEDLYAPENPVPSACGAQVDYDTMHSGGSNFAFLDGHVKWFTPEQMSKVECESRSAPDGSGQ